MADGFSVPIATNVFTAMAAAYHQGFLPTPEASHQQGGYDDQYDYERSGSVVP